MYFNSGAWNSLRADWNYADAICISSSSRISFSLLLWSVYGVDSQWIWIKHGAGASWWLLPSFTAGKCKLFRATQRCVVSLPFDAVHRFDTGWIWLVLRTAVIASWNICLPSLLCIYRTLQTERSVNSRELAIPLNIRKRAFGNR